MESPVAYASVLKDIADETITEVNDSEFGPGLIVSGKQFAVPVENASTATTFFGSNGLWTDPDTSGRRRFLNPELMGGRISALASLYARFRFTRLTIVYVPSVSTQTPNSWVAGFSEDPELDYANTYAEVSQYENAGGSGAWVPMVIDFNLPKEKLWFTDIDTGILPTAEELRLSAQGVVLASYNAVSGSTVDTGQLWVVYELQLFGRVADQAFTAVPRWKKFYTAMDGILAKELPFKLTGRENWTATVDSQVVSVEGVKTSKLTIVMVHDHESPESKRKPNVDEYEDDNSLTSTPVHSTLMRRGIGK
jgi:hypothetical protein